MADNVEVKIGAQTDQLRAAMQMAATSVAGSLKDMATALSSFNANTKRSSAGVYSFADDVKHAMGVAAGNVLIATVGIGKAMLALIPIAATAAAGIGVALLGVGVFAMIRMQDEVQKLQTVLGMASTEATVLSVALTLIGKNADDFNNVALKLANGIKTDEQRMNQLGIVTRDANGALVPMTQLMQNSFTAMQQYKSGTDQAAFAQEIFQKSTKEVYDLMNNLPAALDRAKQLTEKLNIEMGPNAQAAIEQYKLQMGSLRVTVEALAVKVGQAVMPALNGLADWLLAEGPGAIEVIVGGIKLFVAALSILSAAVRGAWEYVSAVFSNIGTNAVTLGQVVLAAFRGDFGAIPGIVAAGYKKVEDRAEQAKRKLIDIHAQLGDSLGALFGDKTQEPSGKSPLASGDRAFTAKAKKGAGAPHDQSVMQYLEADLKEQQNAYNNMKLDQGSFETWSVEQTRAYWANILTSDLLGTKDRLAVKNKFYDADRSAQERAFKAQIAAMESQRAGFKHNLEAQIAIVEAEYAKVASHYGKESTEAEAVYHRLVELRQRLADQRIRIAEIEAGMEAAAAQHGVAMAALVADQAVNMRRMSAQQRLEIDRQLEEKSYAIKVAALEKDRALYAGDVVKSKQIDAQLEVAEQQHQQRLTQIVNAAEQERMQFALQASQTVQDTLGNTIAGLITKTKEWKDVLKDAVKSLTASLNQIAGNAIAKQFLGAGTEGGNMLNSIMGKIFGGGGGAGAGAAAGKTPEAIALTSSATALTTSSTLLDTAASTTSTALTLAATELTSAAAALSGAASALSAGGGGGGGGGLGSLFGGGGGGGGIGGGSGGFGMFDAVAGYAVGTPYVPQDSLAFLHKGEAVVPAKYNRGGIGGGFRNTNQFVISGPIDTRTQQQVQTAAAKGVRRASLRSGGR